MEKESPSFEDLQKRNLDKLYHRREFSSWYETPQSPAPKLEVVSDPRPKVFPYAIGEGHKGR